MKVLNLDPRRRAATRAEMLRLLHEVQKIHRRKTIWQRVREFFKPPVAPVVKCDFCDATSRTSLIYHTEILESWLFGYNAVCVVCVRRSGGKQGDFAALKKELPPKEGAA